MRVLVVNQFYSPDTAPTAQLLTDLCEYLVRAGNDVTAIAGRGVYRSGDTLSARELINGVRVVRPWSSHFGRTFMAGRAVDYLSFGLAAVAACVAQQRPDVILTLTTPPLIAAGVLEVARSRKVPVVIWSQDVYPEVAAALGVIKADGLSYRFLRKIAQRANQKATKIVALSEDMATRIRSQGAAHGGVVVCPNWANGALIHPPELGTPAHSHSAFREANGWVNKFVVMYSGNLGLAHEVGTVCQAAELLARVRPNVQLVFVGGGAREGELRARTSALTNVSFLPLQAKESLSDTLGAADCHLVLLREDVCGLVVPSKFYGALASGRPVFFIGPIDCDIAKQITEHDLGWAGRPGQVGQFVGALTRAAESPAWAEGAGRRARDLFERNFDQPLALARWQAILISACSAIAG